MCAAVAFGAKTLEMDGGRARNVDVGELALPRTQDNGLTWHMPAA
jgi:hypothetical protein